MKLLGRMTGGESNSFQMDDSALKDGDKRKKDDSPLFGEGKKIRSNKFPSKGMHILIYIEGKPVKYRVGAKKDSLENGGSFNCYNKKGKQVSVNFNKHPNWEEILPETEDTNDDTNDNDVDDITDKKEERKGIETSVINSTYISPPPPHLPAKLMGRNACPGGSGT